MSSLEELIPLFDRAFDALERGDLDGFTDVTRDQTHPDCEVRGDDVLLFLADFEFIGAASGAALEGETGAVFEYEDGLCVRINSFMSREQARRVAEAIVGRSGAKASGDADA